MEASDTVPDSTRITSPLYAPDFELPGTDGAVHHLARYLERFRAVSVIIMCNHCPYVRLYLDRLKQLQAEIQPQGATLIGINANDERQFPEDSFAQMQQLASEQALNFPYLRDVTQEVASGFGASRTPEAFLIDQTGVIRYQGAIDDQPQTPEQFQTRYLYQAIADVLAGNPIMQPSVEAIGCSVKWRT